MQELMIRSGVLEDLPRLTEIYNYYVRESAVTFDVEAFSVERRREEWFGLFSESGRYRLVVAECGGEVMGYACTVPFHKKPAYATSVETSVYLAPEATGKGIGAKLYAELFERLRGAGVHRYYAGVTQPNPASMALHKKFGFRKVGALRECGFKFGKFRDVVRLEKEGE